MSEHQYWCAKIGFIAGSVLPESYCNCGALTQSTHWQERYESDNTWLRAENERLREAIGAAIANIKVVEIERGKVIDAAYAQIKRLQSSLETAWSQMDRARMVLTNNNPRPDCFWGMLNTADLREALQNPP